MKTQPILKTAQLLLAISFTFNIILVIAVIIQYSHIKGYVQNSRDYISSGSSSKDSRSGSNSVMPLSKNTRSTGSIQDKDKIKTLESKIADMQTIQDDLKKTLSKYEIKREEWYYKSIENKLSSRFKIFIEENNLSTSLQTEFIELLTQRELEINDLAVIKNNMSEEEYKRELEKIVSDYDDMISNLLSHESYYAYHDFLKSEEDRPIVDSFKEVVFTGSNKLSDQQEKDLLIAISNKRHTIEEAENVRLKDIIEETMSSSDGMKKYLDLQKKLFNGYLEISDGILTGSQKNKFKKYMDTQISSIELSEQQNSLIQGFMNSDTEENDS